MEKKLKSKPMQAILSYMAQYNDLVIDQFDQDVIMNSPIEEWPKCDALISFYSSGFPIDKALKYVQRYKPIQINDLESQKILWDRRQIYNILTENNIPVSRHFIVDRKEQPVIDQAYLEQYAKANKNRGEYLIKYAQEQRERFDNATEDHT